MTHEIYYTTFVASSMDWCEFIHTVDEHEMNDVNGSPIGKAEKKCN